MVIAAPDIFVVPSGTVFPTLSENNTLSVVVTVSGSTSEEVPFTVLENCTAPEPVEMTIPVVLFNTSAPSMLTEAFFVVIESFVIIVAAATATAPSGVVPPSEPEKMTVPVPAATVNESAPEAAAFIGFIKEILLYAIDAENEMFAFKMTEAFIVSEPSFVCVTLPFSVTELAPSPAVIVVAAF